MIVNGNHTLTGKAIRYVNDERQITVNDNKHEQEKPSVMQTTNDDRPLSKTKTQEMSSILLWTNDERPQIYFK